MAEKKPLGLLILHGFTGSLDTVKALVPRAEARGWPWRMPVMRGHGTKYQDLVGVRYGDWVADAEAALDDLLAECDKVVIAGLSMGGGQAMAIGLNRLDVFSHVGVFSSGGGNAAEWSKTYASLIADAAKTNGQMRLLWVGCGTEDGAFAGAKRFADFLGENKIKHTFRASEGAHTWMVWRRYLNEISPLLFR